MMNKSITIADRLNKVSATSKSLFLYFVFTSLSLFSNTGPALAGSPCPGIALNKLHYAPGYYDTKNFSTWATFSFTAHNADDLLLPRYDDVDRVSISRIYYSDERVKNIVDTSDQLFISMAKKHINKQFVSIEELKVLYTMIVKYKSIKNKYYETQIGYLSLNINRQIEYIFYQYIENVNLIYSDRSLQILSNMHSVIEYKFPFDYIPDFAQWSNYGVKADYRPDRRVLTMDIRNHFFVQAVKNLKSLNFPMYAYYYKMTLIFGDPDFQFLLTPPRELLAKIYQFKEEDCRQRRNIISLALMYGIYSKYYTQKTGATMDQNKVTMAEIRASLEHVGMDDIAKQIELLEKSIAIK